MSLTRRLQFLFLLTSMIVGLNHAQMFTDQGLLSGSGLTILPTATIAPPSEFRVQVSRIGYSKGGGRGVNVFGLGAGLSESLEGYVRVTGEQSGTFMSEISYGFGAKLRLPLIIPVVRRLAMWVDMTSSDQFEASSLFPSDARRAAVAATFDSNGIHPTILLGISRTFGDTHPLAGAGVTIAANNQIQLGFEFIHGYLAMNSAQLAATVSYRAFSNVSLHFSPGYLSSGGTTTGMLMLGISCTTADIDFHPIPEELKGDEFILPSIEEIERQQKEDQQKPPGGGSMLLDPQSPEMPEPLTVPAGNITQKNTTVIELLPEHRPVEMKKKEIKKEENRKP